MTDVSKPRASILPAILLLVDAVLLVYAPTLFNGFVRDDHHLIERNQVVRSLDPTTHLTADFWSRRDTTHLYYRPVVTWSLALNHAIHGTTPWGYHLFNMLIHASSVVLLFLILGRFRDPPIAWLGAALFALHPIQSESVAWVLGRTDLLACFFVLLGAWLHAGLPDPLTRRALPRIASVILVGVAALLSKESAVAFPAVFLAADLAARRAEGAGWSDAMRRTWSRWIRVGPIYLLLLAGYLALRLWVTGQMVGPDENVATEGLNHLLGAPMDIRLLTSVAVAGRYLGLVVFPLHLSIDYQFDVVPLVSSAASAAFLLPLLAVSVAAMVGLWIARSRPAGLFGALVAALAYFPVSNLLFPVPALMAERFLYLPMVGISALLAAGLVMAVDRLVDAPRRRRALLVVGVSICIALGARTLIRTFDYKNDLVLFASGVRVAPRSVHSWHGLGLNHSRRGETKEALEAFERALEIEPSYLSTRLSRVAMLRVLGRIDEAEEETRKIVAEEPGSNAAELELIETLSARARELEARGEPAAARPVREEIAERGLANGSLSSPETAGMKAVFLNTAAGNLAHLGRTEEAEQAYRRAQEEITKEISAGGAVPEVTCALASVVHGAAGDFFRGQARWADAGKAYSAAADAAAIASDADTVSRMTFNAVESWRRAGETSLREGRAEEAVSFYDRVIEKNPSSERARHGRARAHLALHDAAGAEEDLRILLGQDIGGRQAAAAATDLAIALAMRGEWERSIEQTDRALEFDPSYTLALFRRGTYRMEAGDADLAEIDLESALDAGLPTGAEVEVWFRLGKLAAARGETGLAERRLQRCLELHPGQTDAQALLERLRQN